jgi:hypothetical protein
MLPFATEAVARDEEVITAMTDLASGDDSAS